MTTLAMLACATGPTEARFAVRVDTGPVRIAYSTTEPTDGVPMASPSYSTSEAVDATGAAKVTITGLDPLTRYWWRVEDNGTVDDSRTATFLMPPAPGSHASYTVTASGDAGLTPEVPGATGTELLPDRISNHEIHAYIASRMITEDWLAHLGLGDITYYDYGRPGFAGSTEADYERGYDDLHLQPNQVELFEAGSFIHQEDDHGAGPNDWDETFTDKVNFAAVFRRREPHHDLPDTGATYRTWTWGRAQWIVWDVRYYRSPSSDPDGPSKTMLGSAQKTWFEGLLDTSTAEILVIVSPVQWMSGGDDSWPGYATERDEIAAMIDAYGWTGRIIMISADAHYLAIDTGGNNSWGGWPCAVFASRDATPTIGTEGSYDILSPRGGRGQYGTITVTDLGSMITVKLTAWQNGTEVGSYTKAFDATPSATAADVTDLVSGSHRAMVEARVVTEYQTGDDPDGEEIPVLTGDVAFDATADVWANAQLETAGVDEEDLTSRFPRFPDDLLAPYGNEIYLRRGIDTGASVLWTPLGYFRIDDTEQIDSSEGRIRLTAPDRMQGLIDARLITPRQYRSFQTIAAVVYDLVLDVYPDAVVAWDDDTEQLPIGRDLVIEQDRYAALKDIATSRGKVMYFDSLGVLRFEDAPDPDQIVWDIKAGRDGVLVTSTRRVSSQGVHNGVVARGQGVTDSPALGIVVDTGPNSPTRWGGRFGKRPRFYESPLLTDNAQARKAAESILRRVLGMPYSVDFGVIPNPALRPRQAVRIAQRDGNREKHLVQTLTVPLTADQAMTGTTKEQTLLQVGSFRPTEATAQGGD
ncbi:hypothetical protein GCM10027447_12350 [Glycomyces halotolerans]